jgi:hypothetical protein
MSGSAVELRCGDNDTAPAVWALLRHCVSKPFYLRAMSFEDSENQFGAAVRHGQAFSDQQSSVGDVAYSGTARISDFEVNEFALDDWVHPDPGTTKTLAKVSHSSQRASA